jgi:glycerol kinase
MKSIFYSSDTEQAYLLEGSVNAAGDVLEWARTRLHLFHDNAEVDDLCWKAGTDVVAFVGLNGIGAPHWEPFRSTSIHGLVAESTHADMVRAFVEGIAFFLKDIAVKMESGGIYSRSHIRCPGD